MSKKPNILFIMTDQHRFDALGCMGNQVVKTPNLDKLAESSCVFDAAYTPCPVCAPARASIFSGQYPNGCGVITNWVPFNGNQILIPEQLKNAGYTTGGVGKLHFVPHVKSWGFDFKQLHDAPYSVYADDDKYSEYINYLGKVYGKEKAERFVELFDQDESSLASDPEQFIMGRNFIPEEHHMVTWTTDESIRFLKERDKDKPFFLYTGYFGPHHPWLAPEKWNTYNAEDIDVSELDLDYSDKPALQAAQLDSIQRNRKLFSRNDYQRIIAAYYGQVSMIDHYIGKIFDELKAQKLWDDTIVVFTADHGDHNGHFGLFFKCTMLESSARVPLIIKPAGSSKMKRIDIPAGNVDIYGTIMEAAGVEKWKYKHIESGSLNSLMSEESSHDPSPCYSILGKQSMLRRGNYKLIRYEQDGNARDLYELYYLADNKLEEENIYDCPEVRDIREELRRQLDNWTMAQKQPRDLKWRK